MRVVGKTVSEQDMSDEANEIPWQTSQVHGLAISQEMVYQDYEGCESCVM